MGWGNIRKAVVLRRGGRLSSQLYVQFFIHVIVNINLAASSDVAEAIGGRLPFLLLLLLLLLETELYSDLRPSFLFLSDSLLPNGNPLMRLSTPVLRLIRPELDAKRMHHKPTPATPALATEPTANAMDPAMAKRV